MGLTPPPPPPPGGFTALSLNWRCFSSCWPAGTCQSLLNLTRVRHFKNKKPLSQDIFKFFYNLPNYHSKIQGQQNRARFCCFRDSCKNFCNVKRGKGLYLPLPRTTTTNMQGSGVELHEWPVWESESLGVNTEIARQHFL